MKCSFSILLVKNVLHQIIHLLKRQSNLGVSQQNIQKTQSRKDLSVMNLFWVESRVENYYAQIGISTNTNFLGWWLVLILYYIITSKLIYKFLKLYQTWMTLDSNILWIASPQQIAIQCRKMLFWVTGALQVRWKLSKTSARLNLINSRQCVTKLDYLALHEE